MGMGVSAVRAEQTGAGIPYRRLDKSVYGGYGKQYKSQEARSHVDVTEHSADIGAELSEHHYRYRDSLRIMASMPATKSMTGVLPDVRRLCSRNCSLWIFPVMVRW